MVELRLILLGEVRRREKNRRQVRERASEREVSFCVRILVSEVGEITPQIRFSIAQPWTRSIEKSFDLVGGKTVKIPK